MVLGEMALELTHYHCETYKSSFGPRERALLLETSLLPGVVPKTGLAAAMASFEEVSSLLSELAGAKVNPV
jgi:hypothetical protein